MAEHEGEEKPKRKRVVMNKAKEWGAMLAALSALAGAGANYMGADAHEAKADQAQARTLAQLEAAYKATKDAMDKLEQASKERDKDVIALREAVAEMRGALEVIGRTRPAVSGAAQRASRALEAVDADGIQELIQLPEELPEPTDDQVQQKLKSVKK